MLSTVGSQSRNCLVMPHVIFMTLLYVPVHYISRFTNPDGRYSHFIQKADFTAGRYKLHFDVDRYFELRKLESLYPFIEVIYVFIYLFIT
jgi:hypothetical protein